MRTVTKRELNQHTASVLARVTPADSLVVTERGIPRWRLSAVRDHETALDHLERDGSYTPPSKNPEPWSVVPDDPAYSDGEVDALIDEMRGDH